MILFLQWPNNERIHYNITSIKDLQPIFDMFPNTYEIMLSSVDFKDAVYNIINYLSDHHLNAWIENDDLVKSLKSKALALGLMATTSMVPTTIQHQVPVQKPTLIHEIPEEKPQGIPFGAHPVDRFLWNVQQIESSGGKNTAHKPIKHGQFKGVRAMGKWGLLPTTVQEIVTRMKTTGNLPEGYDQLSSMSRDSLNAYLEKNPQVELDLARQLALHVHSRQKNNMSRSAYSWLHGHNLHPSDIDPEKLANSDYVTKYKQFDRINPFKKQNTELLKTQAIIGDSDLKSRIKAWLERRQEYLTETPMRTSNYQPDLGRVRDVALDEQKPTSLMPPIEKLKHNIKRANGEGK